MKHFIATLFLSLIIISAYGTTDYHLHLWDAHIDYTGKGRLYLGVDCDEDSWNAFSFDIALPKGITMTYKASGYPDFTFLERIPSFNSGSNYQKDKDVYSFYGFHTTRQGIQPGTGPMMFVTLVADETVPDGTYTGRFENIVFTTKEDQTSKLFEKTAEFNIIVEHGMARLDETSTIAPVASSGAVKAEVKRTIKGEEWSTICLPFAMTGDQVKAAFGDDVLLSDYTGWSDEYASEEDENPSKITVQFTRLNAANGMEANHPYIIRTSKDITDFEADGVTISPEEEPTVSTGSKRKHDVGSFIGNYVADFTVPEATLFIANNQFWYSVGKTKMKAYRGYFEFEDVLKSYYDDTSSAKIDFSFDEATGIKAVSNNESKKDVYTIDGIFVGKGISKSLPKGVYIQNGRKFVIK